MSADTEAIHFRSDHYFVTLGQARLRLPSWLEPGRLTISHVDRGDGSFAFILALSHPLFGDLIHQTGVFRERFVPCAEEALPVTDVLWVTAIEHSSAEPENAISCVDLVGRALGSSRRGSDQDFSPRSPTP